MGFYDFRKDLSQEQITLRVLEEVVKENDPAIARIEYPSREERKYWDWKVTYGDDDGGYVLVESKEDYKALETGNIAIEFKTRGSPSGIAITKADEWMHTVHQKSGVLIYIFPIAKLRELVKGAEERVGGDPGSETGMYILPVAKLPEEYLVLRLSKKEWQARRRKNK